MVISRDRWDVEGSELQTPGFVTSVHDASSISDTKGSERRKSPGTSVDHVRWFYKSARRITEPALREGLIVSGATEDEATGAPG